MKRIVACSLGIPVWLVALTASAANDPNWQQVAGCASWITQASELTGHKPDQVFVLGCANMDTAGNRTIFAYTGGSTWMQVPGPNGLGAVQISAYSPSSTWIRHADGTIRRRNPGNATGWDAPLTTPSGSGDACATYIAAGPRESVWAIGCESTSAKSIWRWANQKWISLPEVAGGARQIAFSAHEQAVYVLSLDSFHWKWNGSGWNKLPGTGDQQGTGFQFYTAVGATNKHVYTWIDMNNVWVETATSTFGGNTKLTTGDWAVSADGKIWHYIVPK